MTGNDRQALAALAVVGVAAAYVLFRRDAQAPPGPIFGTGAAISPGSTPGDAQERPGEAEPGILEQARDVIAEWFSSVPAPGASQAVKSPAQWRAELRPLFRRQEESFAMPAGMMEAIADRESRFRHDIITGATLGGVGEMGIMQLRPEFHLSSDAERLDPYTAIPYAAKYLAKNYLRFGTWEEAIAAYNWGPSALTAGGLQNAPTATKEYIAWVKARDYTAAFT